MSEEHPIQQPIRCIEIDTIPESQATYMVGRNGVTRIEACTKSGLHADIPYVRVWKGAVCEAEFCQHNIVGVYFAPPPADEAIFPCCAWCSEPIRPGEPTGVSDGERMHLHCAAEEADNATFDRDLGDS